MKDIAVYIVIVDDYDPLRVPTHQSLSEEADFYCFTNTPMVSDFYTIVPIEKILSSATLTNRYYKILSHPVLSNYRYTVYLDGSLQITASTITPLIRQILGSNDMAVFKHRYRNCVYTEAKAIIYNRRANYKSVYKHVKRYYQEGYPEGFGLVEAGVIIRDNQSLEVKKFEQRWWKEFRNNAHRDQLSFNYVIWQYPIKLTYITGTISNNQFFKYHIRPAKLPPKTLYDKIKCRYWAAKVDITRGKFTFGAYVF